MELLLRIAWRNILRHRGKSIIIGVILFLGSFVMTIGNGVISGMDRGLERNIVNGFMGDAVIIPDKETSNNILFKILGKSVDTITNYSDIKLFLQKQENVDAMIPVGKNAAVVINEEGGEPGYVYLLGVDFAEYRKFFRDNMTAIEGELPENINHGILVPARTRDILYDSMNIWFLPRGLSADEKNFSAEAKENVKTLTFRDEPVFMGFTETNSSSDVRVPIIGIIKYRALNSIWGNFSIIDIESYRRALGYFSAADMKENIREDRKKLLGTENLDAMFGSESLVVADSGSKSLDVDFRRRELSTTEGANLESGVYNLVFVKFRSGVSAESGVEGLNRAIAGTDLKVRAVTWKQGAGPIGNMAMIIKGALFIFVMILFVVAVIIIVNTLTMTTLERVSEIGMMRAIGADREFIRGMFIGETAVLAGIFGGAGLISGIIIVRILPMLKITSTNDMVQLLFGGDTFLPVLSAGDIILALLQLVLVTVVTVIYPARVAAGIVPLDAISRD